MSVAEGDVRLMLGDCLEMMPRIPDQSIDVILCDPPYPEIDRPYGRMTEAEWWDMMMGVCRESRRILKPSGSAVFILQPNSSKVGSMRGWLFRFQAWACDEWNMVQDAWWWNVSTMPVGGSNRHGLLRPSLKACVWLGPPDCYRDQGSILQAESSSNRRDRLKEDFERETCPSRSRSQTEGPRDDYRRLRTACVERGGTTPFNVLAIGSDGRWSGGTHGHGASTPMRVCDQWVRYVAPAGGTVCDPFMGSGTVGLAALKRGRKFVGIERDAGYFATAEVRIQQEIEKHLDKHSLFAG